MISENIKEELRDRRKKAYQAAKERLKSNPEYIKRQEAFKVSQREQRQKLRMRIKLEKAQTKIADSAEKQRLRDAELMAMVFPASKLEEKQQP